MGDSSNEEFNRDIKLIDARPLRGNHSILIESSSNEDEVENSSKEDENDLVSLRTELVNDDDKKKIPTEKDADDLVSPRNELFIDNDEDEIPSEEDADELVSSSIESSNNEDEEENSFEENVEDLVSFRNESFSDDDEQEDSSEGDADDLFSSSDEDEEESFSEEDVEDLVSFRNESFDENEEDNSTEEDADDLVSSSIESSSNEDEDENSSEEDVEDLVSFRSDSSSDEDEEENSSTEEAEDFVSSSLELTPLMALIRDMHCRVTTGNKQNNILAIIRSQGYTDAIFRHINSPFIDEENQLARRISNSKISTHTLKTWTPLGNNRYGLLYADEQPNQFADEPRTSRRFNQIRAERHAFISELIYSTLMERRRLHAVRQICTFLISMQSDYKNEHDVSLRMQLLIISDIVRNLIGFYVFLFFLVLLIFL